MGLQIGITTQTPLVRFETRSSAGRTSGSSSFARGRQWTIQRLSAGPEAKLTPGGVGRMVLPALREWSKAGLLKRAYWFSLQPKGPREIHLDDPPLELHHLTLTSSELAAYARTKEKLWADIHGLPSPPFGTEDFRFYSRYNWKTSDLLAEKAPNLDIAYVHDFQLLQMGALVGLAAPSVFRWHVPFDPLRIPKYTRNFLVRAMEDFDAVVVSTRKDLEGLLRAGYHGRAHQLYPYIDVEGWGDVHASDIAELEEAWGLDPDDPMFLVVARMDPMKRQDLAIDAFARIAAQHPRARLVLVGNGSFSSARSGKGGLGINKADLWVRRLRKRARDLKLQERIRFTHWIEDRQLAAAYARATAVVLASDVEGFGLTVLEAWRYRRPVLVSSGTGASEVVYNGLNGYVFPAGDAVHLAAQMDHFARDGGHADDVGQNGRAFLREFEASRASRRESVVLTEAIDSFGDA